MFNIFLLVIDWACTAFSVIALPQVYAPGPSRCSVRRGNLRESSASILSVMT